MKFTLVDDVGGLEATFLPDCHMVCSSLRHEGEELLAGIVPPAEFAASSALSRGIPLLHPWANRLGGTSYEAAGQTVELDLGSPVVLQENGLPNHGLLARASRWEVVSVTERRLIAELDFSAAAELFRFFPYPHLVRLVAAVGESALTITTTVVPSAGATVPIAFGFHPYFRLPDTPRPQWEMSLGMRRQLVLDDAMLPTGHTVSVTPRWSGRLGEETFDDAFAGPDDRRAFALRGGAREVVVTLGSGFTYAQLYAPREWDFVCFEPMTSPTNALRTGHDLRVASSPFTAEFRIAVASC